MLAIARPTIVLFACLSFITGIAYPLTVTAIAQVAFPHQANGSLIRENDRVVGSKLIGQPFDNPRYFFGRPSATSPVPYNGLGGSGSNLAATNPALRQAVRDRVSRLKAVDPDNVAAIPIDLVTASASGLDPHISPAAARYQAARIARQRGLTRESVDELIRKHTEPATLGFIGQPRVHVLNLNRVLDAAKSL
jgi:potassium-transporting ATPase KdpC subunit